MRPARLLRNARFYASCTDLDAKSVRFHAVNVTKHNPAFSMHIVIKPWLTAFRRNRRQHQALDLYHACFGRALDDPIHTNTRALRKSANSRSLKKPLYSRSLKKPLYTRSLKKLADVICEALHLRFVLDTMHLACEDSQVGPFPDFHFV